MSDSPKKKTFQPKLTRKKNIVVACLETIIMFLARLLGYNRMNSRKFTHPRRIILIRHGESEGNVDENTYAKTPDWQIQLTPHGRKQARNAGKALAELTAGETVVTYVSPYKRTMQSWELIKKELEEHTFEKDDDEGCITLVGSRQEPRIAEQQFGNFQNPHAVRDAKEERHEFGRFFFRFPNGESGLDVYNRATSFLATLSRDVKQLKSNGVSMSDCNICVITHGLTLRLILMRYFQLTVEEFEDTFNPPNATLVIMDRHKSEPYGWEFFRLDDSSKDMLNLKGDVSSEKPVFWREREDL